MDEVQLGATAYPLVPALPALLAAERATGRGLMQLANTNLLPIGDLASVTAELIRAAGGEPPAGMVTLIYEGGAVEVAARVALVLTSAVVGERMADGSLKKEG